MSNETRELNDMEAGIYRIFCYACDTIPDATYDSPTDGDNCCTICEGNEVSAFAPVPGYRIDADIEWLEEAWRANNSAEHVLIPASLCGSPDYVIATWQNLAAMADGAKFALRTVGPTFSKGRIAVAVLEEKGVLEIESNPKNSRAGTTVKWVLRPPAT